MSKQNRVSNSSKKNFKINVIKGGKDAESYGLGDLVCPQNFPTFQKKNQNLRLIFA